MKKAIMLALALAVLCTGAAWAQVGSVVGVVLDRQGAPLVDARVSLHQDGHCAGYVLTDATGAFVLENVEPGVYTLKASKQKVGTVTVEGVEVLDGETTDVGTLQVAGKFVCVPQR